ncbi:hypothetical protein QN416_25420, partial [Glaciimonas sp. Cout2]|nr:hypothetical protein [Glaciimonas sp. Cout2]
QVNAIRIKVQVAKNRVPTPPHTPLQLPANALTALSGLNQMLEDTPRNQALKSALAALVRHHLVPTETIA